jgi:hypothetical protein
MSSNTIDTQESLETTSSRRVWQQSDISPAPNASQDHRVLLVRVLVLSVSMLDWRD